MLGTLLVVLPFGGLRVICIDPATDVSHSTAPTETASDCERMCPFHPPSVTSGTPSSTQSSSDCALSADGSSLSIFANIAVLRPQEPLVVPVAVTAVPADSPNFYREPQLAHLGPPPKPQAL